MPPEIRLSTAPAHLRHGSNIGQPLTRRDGVLKVTGAARYAADNHPPGMLHAVLAVSNIARGEVTFLDVAAAFGLDRGLPFPVTDLGARLNQTTGPFLDSAAVMMNLDLLITCDSSPAHLAGALGAPVWMAISSTPDWRWLTLGETTPWYPSFRLYRQSHYDVWPPVFAAMASELADIRNQRTNVKE